MTVLVPVQVKCLGEERKLSEVSTNNLRVVHRASLHARVARVAAERRRSNILLFVGENRVALDWLGSTMFLSRRVIVFARRCVLRTLARSNSSQTVWGKRCCRRERLRRISWAKHRAKNDS